MLIQYHKQFGKHPKDPYKGFVDGDREDQRINDDKIEEFKTEKKAYVYQETEIRACVLDVLVCASKMTELQKKKRKNTTKSNKNDLSVVAPSSPLSNTGVEKDNDTARV